MAVIAVIGTGYVGLVSGACLSDFGHRVVCVDTDAAKIHMLQTGGIPIWEPGLGDVVARCAGAGRLSFSTDAVAAITDAEIVFIAVGTPPADDGSADLRHVEEAARTIGRVMDNGKVVVNKSTVPIGTGRKVEAWIAEELAARSRSLVFDVVSNPEFLREGSAVYDFMHPDRVVIGTASRRAAEVMRGVYRVLYLNETPFIETGIETAEMIKYASNAFLALKITFINEIANLCEVVGADVSDVAKAMGRDGRIGAKFLHPGPGYGGSCFPKDTRALADIARRSGSPLSLVDAVIGANERQKARMIDKIAAGLGELGGRRIAILGLSFKPGTDDMREAPSLTILRGLARLGARLSVFDPVSMSESRWRLADIQESVEYCEDEYTAARDADALVLLTEWNRFRSLDFGRLGGLMRERRIFDLRNLYDPGFVRASGFSYTGVGR